MSSGRKPSSYGIEEWRHRIAPDTERVFIAVPYLPPREGWLLSITRGIAQVGYDGVRQAHTVSVTFIRRTPEVTEGDTNAN